MEIFWGILKILGLIVILFIVVMFLLERSARKIAPDKYAWLAVLSHSEWKGCKKLVTDLAIAKKCEKIPDYSNFMSFFFLDMGQLENEELVERRKALPFFTVDGFPIYRSEYRLTSKGVRKKNQESKTTSSTSPHLQLQ